ncbi:MAG: hypothetical protein PWQ43_1349 [Rikenellaceae bacterium]|nr:hypothetical protein [Rikenellaceae bacterium]
MENNFKLGDNVYYLHNAKIKQGVIVDIHFPDFEILDHEVNPSDVINFRIVSYNNDDFIDTETSIVKYTKEEIIEYLSEDN